MSLLAVVLVAAALPQTLSRVPTVGAPGRTLAQVDAQEPETSAQSVHAVSQALQDLRLTLVQLYGEENMDAFETMNIPNPQVITQLFADKIRT